jgi:hypothetical protein
VCTFLFAEEKKEREGGTLSFPRGKVAPNMEFFFFFFWGI